MTEQPTKGVRNMGMDARHVAEIRALIERHWPGATSRPARCSELFGRAPTSWSKWLNHSGLMSARSAQDIRGAIEREIKLQAMPPQAPTPGTTPAIVERPYTPPPTPPTPPMQPRPRPERPSKPTCRGYFVTIPRAQATAFEGVVAAFGGEHLSDFF